MKATLKSKILGSLAAGAMGDALGSATEQLTMDEIYETFGGMVDKFYAPCKEYTFAYGRAAGQVTDDTGQMLELVQSYFEAPDNVISAKGSADALLRWAEDPECFAKFAGPTSRAAIIRLREGADPVAIGLERKANMGASNGCAMKIAPAGLFHPGDLNGAIADACEICRPTHATTIGMSAASAVAAAIAEALTPGADLFSVYRASLYGAREGFRIAGTLGRPVAGPNVEARIKLAAGIAMKATNLEDACRKMGESVGTGLPAAEAVPAAIGLMIAAGGDPLKTIAACSTAGDDTDTVAIIAGSIAGALCGFDVVPSGLYKQMLTANPGMDLEGMSDRIYDIVLKKYPSLQ